MSLTPWSASTVGTAIAVVKATMTRVIRTRTSIGACPRVRGLSGHSCPRASRLSPSGDCCCTLSIYGAATTDLRERRASSHPNAQKPAQRLAAISSHRTRRAPERARSLAQTPEPTRGRVGALAREGTQSGSLLSRCLNQLSSVSAHLLSHRLHLRRLLSHVSRPHDHLGGLDLRGRCGLPLARPGTAVRLGRSHARSPSSRVLAPLVLAMPSVSRRPFRTPFPRRPHGREVTESRSYSD